MMSQSSKLILDSSLQGFFYDHLQEFNTRSFTPLSTETIFYSSIVMDNFGNSEKFFDQVNGKVREKILGLKLMESVQLPRELQKKALKEIAEMSLLLCGYFTDSLNKKIIDVKYYEDVGKIAYTKLNSFCPSLYDVPSFYKNMSENFSDVTLLMSLVSKKYSKENDPDLPWLILKSETTYKA
jgi:hypothetical protein